MDTIIIADVAPDRGTSPELSGAELLRRARRIWWLLPILWLLAIAATILIVRVVRPQFEAQTTVVQKTDSNSSALSLLAGSVTGSLEGSSQVDELEAVLKSRRLATLIADDPRFRHALAIGFPHKPPSAVMQALFGLEKTLFDRDHHEDDLAEQIRQSMIKKLTLDQKGSVTTVSYRSPELGFVGPFLQHAINVAQSLMVARQLRAAEEYQQYLTHEIAQNRNEQQNDLLVLTRLLPDAIARTTKLSGPTAQVFQQLDSVRVDRNPVSPRIALVLAVCIALATLLFAAIAVWTRAPRR